MVKIFLSLVAIASLGGIFTIASGSAVPGNILYPFKIGVCESIGQLVALGDGAKGTFSLELARQRLIELQILEQNSTATPARRDYLLNEFDSESQKIQDVITVLQVEEKFDEAKVLIAEFQTLLKQQLAVFTALGSPTVPHLQATLTTITALTLMPGT